MAAVLTAAAPALGADSIYWGNNGGSKMSFVALDATDAGDLNTTGASAVNTLGTAIDSAAASNQSVAP